MYNHIVAFEKKLQLWEHQLRNKIYAHFPSFQARKSQDSEVFVNIIQDLRNEFASRFADFSLRANQFKLFVTPFDAEMETVSKYFQIELTDMQCDDILRSKFHSKDVSLIDFYAKYIFPSGKYTNLVNRAKKIASLFGSTYQCEQIFSKLKQTKNNLRTRLTDNHLDNIFLLASTSLKPNIEKLSRNKKH
ncbi:general transcription factor II-I repeat domain-containing protein 2B [Octopus bimaculoides]|nr:general transcription factor II-I repeat domain-containing protein 2B [Octopus bimaculoides]|eukprot:XP_014781932.1 PREDICTED: general transcription factor II-I repeat domain-containing protein 2B-like [Octopus bimaculoides]